MEFIGRSMATPVVKLLNQTYSKPFFPPVLQWFPIRRGEDKAGDLLAAFELFQVRSSNAGFCTFLAIPFPTREFTQHDAPAGDEPKKSGNERGHAILSQALARI